MTESELIEMRWKHHTIDAYKPLAYCEMDEERWLNCARCFQKPRLWIFDNGSHAKCLCADKYGPDQARSECINSVFARTSSFVDYDRNNLRLAWNKYAKTGVPQNTLPEGRW